MLSGRHVRQALVLSLHYAKANGQVTAEVEDKLYSRPIRHRETFKTIKKNRLVACLQRTLLPGQTATALSRSKKQYPSDVFRGSSSISRLAVDRWSSRFCPEGDPNPKIYFAHTGESCPYYTTRMNPSLF